MIMLKLKVIPALVLTAQFSLQAPPFPRRRSNKQEYQQQASELFKDGSSLLHIVKNRPLSLTTQAGIEFKRAFARHPDVRSLEGLSGDDYITQAVKIREHVKDEPSGVKKKMTSAMLHYMIDKGVDDQLQFDVKAVLAKTAKRSNDNLHRDRMKRRDPQGWAEKRRDPQGWAEKRRRYDKQRDANRKQRKEGSDFQGGDVTLFEEKIKALHLPDNASAKQIEEAAPHSSFTQMSTPRYS